MRTETVEYKIYKFEELSDEAKQKALESFSDINVDLDWYESSYEYFEEQLQEIGLKANGFWFDLGRGAFIEMKKPQFLDAKALVLAAAVKEGLKVRPCIVNLIQDQLIIQHQHYCSSHVKHTFTLNSYFIPERCKRLDKLVLAVEEAINDLVQDKLEDFRIALEKECEYLQSEEAIKETIACNDYDFLENGKLY